MNPIRTSDQTLNKLTKLLSKFISGREIARKYGINREIITKYFNIQPYKISYEEISSITKKIAKKNITYSEIKKRYGLKGLWALGHANDAKMYLEMLDKAKQVIKLRDKYNLSFHAIGIQINLSSRRAHELYINVKGVKSSGSVQVLKGKQRAEKVIELYKSGITTIREISSITGMAQNTISRILVDNGIHTRIPMSYAEFCKIHKMRLHGLEWKQIGYIYGENAFNVSTKYRGMYPKYIDTYNKEEKHAKQAVNAR